MQWISHNAGLKCHISFVYSKWLHAFKRLQLGVWWLMIFWTCRLGRFCIWVLWLENLAQIAFHLLFDWSWNWLWWATFLDMCFTSFFSNVFDGIVILRPNFMLFADAEKIMVSNSFIRWYYLRLLTIVWSKNKLTVWRFMILTPRLLIQNFIVEFDFVLQIFLFAEELLYSFFFVFVNAYFWRYTFKLKCLLALHFWWGTSISTQYTQIIPSLHTRCGPIC